MLTRWHLNYLAWPEWVRLLMLVVLMVLTMAMTVVGFSWLLSLLQA